MKMLYKIFRWAAITIVAVLSIIIIIYIVVYFQTESRINKQYTYQIPEINIPDDPAAISQGAHLFNIRGCVDCHGKDLSGKIYINDPLLLQLTVPNITKGPGGLPANFGKKDWIRVLRHGVDKNGRSLWIMPSHESSQLSKADMGKLIAYCMSMPAATSNIEKLHQIGPIGRVVTVIGQATVLPAERIDHNQPLAAVKRVEISPSYGKYLSATCQGCHRPDLQGGGPLAPGYPPVPNITSAGDPGKWNEQLFIKTIRTGNTPEGKKLRNEFMPWKDMDHFTDVELKAIYMYLRSLPGK